MWKCGNVEMWKCGIIKLFHTWAEKALVLIKGTVR